MTILSIYKVKEDPDTGAWLHEPVDTGETTTLKSWCLMKDTADQHFDTYVYDHETQAERAIIMEWV